MEGPEQGLAAGVLMANVIKNYLAGEERISLFSIVLFSCDECSNINDETPTPRQVMHVSLEQL